MVKKLEGFKIVLIIVISLFSALLLLFSILSKKPIRTLIFNAFMGIVTLAIIDLTSKFTNVYIPINIYTVSGSAVFGIPALCGFLILKILIL